MTEKISCGDCQYLPGHGSPRRPYLELRGGIGRVGRKQLQHVDDAADGPRAHAIVLVLQQALLRQLLCDGQQRFAVRLFLVNGAQLVEQRLEARQEVAHADLLPRPSDQRLLEDKSLGVIALLPLLFLLNFLLLLFDFLGRGRRAAPTARSHVAWLRVWIGSRLARAGVASLLWARPETRGCRGRTGVE
jgi:hypothetical protein